MDQKAISFKKLLVYSVIFVFFGWFIIYVLGNDTRCFVRLTTGIPCPGCGMSRAYSALLAGDLTLALRMHPLFWLPPLIGGIILLRKRKPFDRIYRNNTLWLILLAFIVGTYIIRMILMFPNEIPMQFNDQGLLPRLVNLLFH